MSKMHKNIFILFLCTIIFLCQLTTADAKKKKEKDLTPTMRKSLKIDARGHAVIDEQYENLLPDGEVTKDNDAQEATPKSEEAYEQLINELFNEDNSQPQQEKEVTTQDESENITPPSKELESQTAPVEEPEEKQGLISSFKEKIQKSKEERQEKKEKKKKAKEPPVEELVPQGDYRFVKYNDLAGEIELDLLNLKVEKQLNTSGCISPDFSKLVYSQVYFYPSINRVASELFYINLDKTKPPMKSVREATIKDRVEIPLLSKGLENVDSQIFKTIVPVDWSYDSSKLLIKTRYGETQRDLWECSTWIYDFDTNKIHELSNLKKDIRDDYLNRFGVILSAYQWDVQPIGWDINNHERIIVYAYGMKRDKHRIFLGAWSVGYKNGDILFLSKTKNNYQIGKYGYKVKRFD